MDNTPVSEYGTWPLGQLSDHIEQFFHRYIRSSVPAINGQLQSLIQTTHPELKELSEIFTIATDELEIHLVREEQQLFPLINALTSSVDAKSASEKVRKLIDTLKDEHTAEKTFFNHIITLTSNYTTPDRSETALKELYAKLHDFDKKLRRHIQLEDEALFPTAIEMADQAAQ